jgi:flagellar hook-associated protein 2
MRLFFSKSFLIFLFLLFFIINPLTGYFSFADDKKKIGVSEFFGTGLNTDEMVNKLVDVEKQKGEKYQQEISNQIIRKAIVNFLESNLKDLRETSKSIYDYRSPFGNRLGFSSDENIVKVLPNRGAEIREVKIRVEKMAKPDVFVSDSLTVGSKLNSFNFTISVGDKSYNIAFNGGTLYDLAKAINDVASDVVSASVVKVDKDNEVIRISSKKTGKSNRVIISGDISELTKIGLLGRNVKKDNAPSEVDLLHLFTPSDTLNLKQKTTLSNDINYTISEKSFLEVSNTFYYYDVPKLKDVDIKLMESVKVSNVEVRGGSAIGNLQSFVSYVTNDYEFIILVYSDGSQNAVKILTNYQLINLANDKGKILKQVILRNGNDLVDIVFNKIRIFEKKEIEFEPEFNPKNYISHAENAVIYVDGVRIERESNDVDDIINGTIKITGENPEKEISAKVDYDYQSITNAVSNFIEKYNNIMIYLSKLTKPIVDRRQLYEKPDEEKEEGSFSTDTDIIRLKDKLRFLAMQPYKTVNTNIRLLYHIGIYTKNIETKLDFQSDLWEYVRRGILTLDNEKFTKALLQDIDAVKQVFAGDTNSDKIVDSGFAYEVSSLSDEYTRVNGIIAIKKKQIDDTIKANKDYYAKFEERLEDYRKSLESKFARLQQVLRESKSQQDWFKAQMKGLSSSSE